MQIDKAIVFGEWCEINGLNPQSNSTRTLYSKYLQTFKIQTILAKWKDKSKQKSEDVAAIM